MSNKESQKDELCALESIYNKEELHINEENGKSGGQFNAHIDLIPDFKIIYRDLRQDDCATQEMPVEFLPPLVLFFSLPDSYPSDSPPSFTLSCQWLRKVNIAKLCKKLDEMWIENQGMEILFLWTQFLKEESLKFLDIVDILDISELHTYYVRLMQHMKRQSQRRAEKLARDSDRSKKVVEDRKDQDSSVISQLHCLPSLGSSKDDPSQINHSRSGEERRKKPSNRARRGSHSNLRQGNRPRKSQERNAVPSLDIAVRDVKVAGIQSDSNKVQEENWDDDNQIEFISGDAKEKIRRKGKKPIHQRDERAVLDLSPQTSPVRLLYDYNETRQLAVFNRNIYSCKVCFQDKMGSQCTRFSPCGHVFCRDCISGYFEVRIQDGSVQSIGCPEEKCPSEALPSQVKDLVSADLFAKYDSVLLNAMLDTMTDILYCPRPSCQYPVSCEPDEKMATCPACHYAFCVYCKMVYHGIEPCRFKSAEKRQLVEEYQNASFERRLELEQRYGKKQLRTLVDTTMSEVWINDNSKNCPHCNAAIEKSDGCNKMICWRCNTFFCWLCNARLNPQCPYLHFNSTSSGCFNKLFLGVPLDEEDYFEED